MLKRRAPPHLRQLSSNTRSTPARPFIRASARQRAVALGASLMGLTMLGRQALAEDRPPDAGPPGASIWNFSIGIGAFNGSRYPGSRYEYNRVLPLPSVAYGRFFFGATPNASTPAGLGFNVIQDEHWRFGIGLGSDLRKPRYASDDPILHGWGDIRSTERGAVFGSYSSEWFMVRGAASQDIGGKHEGLQVSLATEGRIQPMQGLTLSAGPEVFWVNQQYMQTFFGVSAAQSAIAGIPEYNVRSGVENWIFSVGAQYSITCQWMIGARASYGRYEGDAADSPVTTRKDPRVFGILSFYLF